MAKDQLIFDTSSADTILDSDNVGAYVRSDDGTLITKHSIAEGIAASLISQGLQFKSKLLGAAGNAYSFEVIDSAGSGPLSFTEIGGAIVLDIDGLTPTIAEVVAALASNTYADVLAGSPLGNVAVAGAVSFAGGEDSNFHQHLDVYAALADGEGNPITSENGGLNVNVLGGVNVEVDLSHVDDSVRLGDGTAFFTSTSENSDIALDVHISNSTIAVTQSTSPWVVSATDFDIRDLSHLAGKDSVQLGDGTSLFTSTTIGSDIGLDVNMINDPGTANAAILSAADTLGAAGTADKVVSSNLAARKYLNIYNNFNRKVYIGGSAVDKDNGFPLSPGSYIELRAGAAVDVYYDSEATGAAIRTLEQS